MAYVIAEPCVGVKDTACITVCPVDCIHPRPESPEFPKNEQLYINAADCICCHLCTDECPVNAIFADDDLPAEWAAFIEKNAGYFRESPGESRGSGRGKA